MSTLAAIIVNWNGGSLAVDSIRSLQCQSARPEIWVVDNASTDGSAAAIKIACPDVRMMYNHGNNGFARGNNQAWNEASGADYLLLMNNDVILPDSRDLACVIESLDTHQNVHGVCGRYEYPNGEFQHFYNQLPTAFDLIVTWGIGKHWPFFHHSHRSRSFHLLDGDFDNPLTLEQPAFSCVLLRGSCARTVGMFDEQFPIFLNDVDYCWRWRAQGWTWHYLPWWKIIHHKSRSTGKMGGRLQTEFACSAARFARKHFSPGTSAVIRSAIVLEALWRKICHGDFELPLRDVWAGKSPFLASQGVM